MTRLGNEQGHYCMENTPCLLNARLIRDTHFESFFTLLYVTNFKVMKESLWMAVKDNGVEKSGMWSFSQIYQRLKLWEGCPLQWKCKGLGYRDEWCPASSQLAQPSQCTQVEETTFVFDHHFANTDVARIGALGVWSPQVWRNHVIGYVPNARVDETHRVSLL